MGDNLILCDGLRGRGLSEGITGVKRLRGPHECRRDGDLGFKRFEVAIQDFGRAVNDVDLNQPDLEEEKEGAGEVGGVMGSVEDEEADGEEPAKDNHDDVRDMELEIDVVEGAGDSGVGEEAIEQTRQGGDLRG